MVIFFFFLFIIILMSSVFVVNILNPVHSVFFLILTFLSGSLFLFFLRNEFISIIFVIVYIGAISVLFLFVIMLLDVKLIELKSNFISYVPISLLFILLFFFETLFFLKFFFEFVYLDVNFIMYTNWLNFHIFNLTNVHIIGFFLYTYYFLIFLFRALLLFIATLGSILLSFVSFKNTSFIYNKKYEIISYQYFVDYTKIIKY